MPVGKRKAVVLDCEECGKRVADTHMTQHMNKFHYEDDPERTGSIAALGLRCSTCTADGFPDGASKRAHEKAHRAKAAGDYGCSSCDKTFSRSSSLTRHMLTHTGERPYPCRTCDKTFKQSAHLTAHERTHTGERLYPCRTCDRAFKQSSDLTAHERTHTGERPYPCRTCGGAFTTASNLARHTRIHTGTR